jgi:hypothetical protein
VPVRTPRSVIRTPPCRLAESHDFSPPPSPAIAVFATFSSLPRLLDARAGCEMVTTPSPLGAFSIVNGYPKRTLSRPSGRACCFVFRVPAGRWGTPVEPTPSLRPRRAQQVWLRRAALCGVQRQSPNRRIARRCQRRRDRPGRLRVRLSASASAVERAGPSPARLPCRDTPLHLAAWKGRADNIAELLLRGADGAVQDKHG